MFGRRLLSEDDPAILRWRDPACARRRAVLRETLAAFEPATRAERWRHLAADNLARWRARARAPGPTGGSVRVIAGDWGEVTRALTEAHGVCFAVLNMANAHVPGGAYVEGAVAQEENIFRRTDCHFSVDRRVYEPELDRYLPAMTRRLSAADGEVYLDVARPRVCIRGPEDRTRDDLGYPWLADDQVFPFFELRAAAMDLRDGSPFDPGEARRRIVAQLVTLERHGVRHAVLGAFGCGAFMNPAVEVARIYREALAARRDAFDLVAFAIFHAGYGPDNHAPFAAAFTGAETTRS